MSRSRPLALLAVAFAAGLIILLAFAPAGAGAAQPIKGKPKIVDVEGFAYPTDTSLENWRAGALVLTRYPKVLPSDFPGQIRKLLSFRAVGGLKVFDHGTRIASRKDKGGLPVAVEGRSVYYAHLLVATQKQSDRIFHSLGLEHPIAKGWPSAGNVRTKASAQVRVKAKGRTIAHSGTKSAQAVTLAGAADGPRVVNGCWIVESPRCAWHDLRGADLSNADLGRGEFTGADFSGADLSGADLTLADLYSAKFAGANLAGASLYAADLFGADLTNADLTNADLTNADLSYANLTGADLTDAWLVGTTFCETTLPGGSINNRDC